MPSSVYQFAKMDAHLEEPFLNYIRDMEMSESEKKNFLSNIERVRSICGQEKFRVPVYFHPHCGTRFLSIKLRRQIKHYFLTVLMLWLNL